MNTNSESSLFWIADIIWPCFSLLIANDFLGCVKIWRFGLSSGYHPSSWLITFRNCTSFVTWHQFGRPWRHHCAFTDHSRRPATGNLRRGRPVFGLWFGQLKSNSWLHTNTSWQRTGMTLGKPSFHLYSKAVFAVYSHKLLVFIYNYLLLGQIPGLTRNALPILLRLDTLTLLILYLDTWHRVYLLSQIPSM